MRSSPKSEIIQQQGQTEAVRGTYGRRMNARLTNLIQKVKPLKW